MDDLDEKECGDKCQIPQEHHLQLTVMDVENFLTRQAYGNETPSENDEPSKRRSNNILYYKELSMVHDATLNAMGCSEFEKKPNEKWRASSPH